MLIRWFFSSSLRFYITISSDNFAFSCLLAGFLFWLHFADVWFHFLRGSCLAYIRFLEGKGKLFCFATVVLWRCFLCLFCFRTYDSLRWRIYAELSVVVFWTAWASFVLINGFKRFFVFDFCLGFWAMRRKKERKKFVELNWMKLKVESRCECVKQESVNVGPLRSKTEVGGR